MRANKRIEKRPVVTKCIDDSLKVLPFLDIVGRRVIAHSGAINILLSEIKNLEKKCIALFVLASIQVVGSAGDGATLPDLRETSLHLKHLKRAV